ncbi:TPA: hypothetical protein SLZ57_002898 [Vibrio cholerae]|uniref:Uncharacterized protein n=1 Tax=Citrobacter freundii TaxID=546 RepID=A0A386JBM7_CITFR|nr:MULTISPECIES: hypothetical protein [Gammaproteobacteria]HBZ8439478.1 hypothetical protein [Klebsiella aerogenes]HBZ8475282.1 hypothetical protein [Klebsiella pneumoniae]HCB3599149.1 hypothetical protein [Serratia marcescens]HDS7654932.1 hypothetical protein [Klebsiella variicola]HEJ2447453.1 hypothetical protein [Vibrio cholerae]
MILSFLDFLTIALIIRGPEFLRLFVEVLQFGCRLDKAQYALACDDHANFHYKEKPCAWFRAKLAVKAFILNK